PAMQTNGGVLVHMQGTATSYTGAIYDVRGRLVRRFTTTTPGAVVWDGRDNDGNLALPGVYFLPAAGGGRQARARFVLIHRTTARSGRSSRRPRGSGPRR